MTSRPPAHHRAECDDDDDDYLPQPPKRVDEAPSGDEGNFIPKASKKIKRLKKAPTSSTKLIPDTTPRARANNQDIDMEEKKPAARSSAAVSSVAVAGTNPSNGDMVSDMTTQSLPKHFEASSDTMRSSAQGVSTMGSASVIHSTRVTKASHSSYLRSIGEQNGVKVGAVAVAGPDMSRSSSSTNEDSFDNLPKATGTEQPLQATLVADLIIPNDNIEIQRNARINTEAEEIANIIQERMLKNAVTAVVQHEEGTRASKINSEADIQSRHWKRTCILLLAVLLIAGAIGAAVGVLSSKEPSNSTDPTSSTESFRNVLFNISGDSLDDDTSPQFKALNWIANVDPENLTVGITDIEIIEQRYVAAVLYYALGGDNWIKKYNFLTGLPVCSWNGNQTSGVICDSTNVRVVTLRLSKNGLRGSIPEEIGYFSDLSIIEMTEGVITGTLPSSLVKLNLLEELNFTSCELVGTIPDFIYTHEQLTTVDLSDNSFMGTIHPSLGNSMRLWLFWVENNDLSGPIPASVGQSLGLTNIDLGNNTLTGTLPEFSADSQMTFFYLYGNNLIGTIPNSIGSSRFLEGVWLYDNELKGTIPTEMGLLSNMADITLYSNRLTGNIPSEIGQLSNLFQLILSANNLNGTIPTELGLLSNLEWLGLDSNRFTGTVPDSLVNLSNLNKVYLFDNDLNGSLDLCGIEFETFAANTCGQDEIECACCTDCCNPDPDYYFCNAI